MKIRFAALFFLILFVSLPSFADPAANTLLQKWLDAIGGKTKLDALHSYHTVMTVETAGLKGKAEEWGNAAGDHRTDLNLQDIYIRLTVFNAAQQRAWMQDQNGKSRELQSRDLAEEITNSYLSSYAQFFPEGRLKGKITAEGSDRLRIQPEGGQEFVVVLDTKSGLPLRLEQPDRDRTRITNFSDWRPVDGVLVAHQQQQTTGDPQYDVLITLNEIRWNEPLEAASFEEPKEAAPDFRFESGNSATGIDIVLNSNHVFVPVSVNGSAPMWFVLDTGAEMTVISTRKTQELKMDVQGKLEARGAGEGSMQVSLLKDATFRVKGVELVNQAAVVFDLEKLEDYEGYPFDGILGYDFISRFIVEIDYAGRKLNLYEKDNYKYAGKGEVIPIVMEGNCPVIQAALVQNGKSISGRYDIDTGNRTSLVLNKPYHDANSLASGVKTIEGVWGLGVGGHSKQKIGRVSEFQMGSYKLAGVITSFSEDTKGAFAETDKAGNIGGEILKHFTVILDYSRNQMILEPNADFAAPFRFDMSGLNLISDGPEFKVVRVNSVIAGSPAAEAGLQEGDEVVNINGKAVAGMSLESIRESLKQEGAELKISYVRAGKTSEVELKLRPLI